MFVIQKKRNVKINDGHKKLSSCGGLTLPLLTFFSNVTLTRGHVASMDDPSQQSQDGALPFSDVTDLLAAAAGAETQQALVARIFVPAPSVSAFSGSVDQFARLSTLSSQLNSFVQQHTRRSDYLDGQDYIWHREPPSISVVCPPSSSRPSTTTNPTQLSPHILFHLRTGGECIEDEWFATHLLVRASTHFSAQHLCISVEDEDGQFLLIEAADYLPEWVAPEAVTNRVWIYDGHLHLIPPHYKADEGPSLPASQAVELVTDQLIPTRASDDVEAAAFARAFEFPSAAKLHHHRTLAYLPRRIARVLAAEPQLISNCVTSIQSRDVVSSRSGSRLVRFPPPSKRPDTSADNDFYVGLYSVRMTRHLYAQLLHDRFFPPRQLGPPWQAAVESYRLRLHGQSSTASTQTGIEDEAQVQVGLRDGRWHDLGAKIWCGMEMSYSESLARRKRTAARSMAGSESTLPAQVRETLIQSLEKLGYFQGEIEGSAKWKQLEAEAIDQYVRGKTGAQISSDAGDEGALLCDAVDRILQQSSTEAPSSTTLLPTAAPEELQIAEDDDSWLQLNPDDIESILQGKAGSSNDGSRAIDEHDAFQRLDQFSSKMEDFIKTKSDVRGAVFEDELEAEDMQVDDEDLLFEDLDEDEQEERVKREVQHRMQTEGEEEKRKLVERLIPRMSEQEWTRRPQSTSQSEVDVQAGGGGDFLSSIDRIASERLAAQVQSSDLQSREIAMREDNHLSAANTELRRRLTSQYMRETSTLLSSQGHNQFDGASDSDDEELEQETSPEVRRQRARDYDIEPDEVVAADAKGAAEVGWDEVGEPAEMGDESEVGNLLEFARISLGLTKEQYWEILEERQSKGKYVPPIQPVQKESQSKSKATSESKLDTFESVMAAMETQLHQLRSSKQPPTPTSSTHPTPTASQGPPQDQEDAELLAHLLKSNSELPSSLQSHLDPDSADAIQAEQLESFLRSFQAQSTTSGAGSGSGPVDVLMRRFGLGSLPADQDSMSRNPTT
ncbi:hypothetical protein PHSY_003115 [Pseudozyma hubeiensis SY62]|uniref:SGT1 protein n=1 Tax=Pseudozyma hubeiensis (strain SY62) TaxID=1305764 RepID=R9P2N8_PSEHS|nr:hypothetical protein PHSY_003115 [Pseudozyma hubeiensis SY62]GAC95539.1 hypothetical protein PHSY_003115 [Pseudozyma hubeiensis SY62]